MGGAFLGYETLHVVRGLAWPVVEQTGQWEWRSGDKDPETGLPPLVDITGYTATMKIRASREDDAAALVELDESAGITLGDEAGTVVVEMTAEQTAALPKGTSFYDLVLFPPSGPPVAFRAGEIHTEQWMGRT